jgi:trehalose/maltose hydrolase-like predicted phosphorylase
MTEEGEAVSAALVAEVHAVLEQEPTSEDATWTVSVPAVSDIGDRVAESLFTVSDGVIGTRGSLEEDGPSTAPTTVAAGLYEVAPGTGQSLLVIPAWNELALRGPVHSGRRLLDLRSGVLWRTVDGPNGTLLRTARWASLARPGVEVLVAEGHPEVLDPAGQGPQLQCVERRSTLGAGIVGFVETRTAMAHSSANTHSALARLATFGVGTLRLPRRDGVSARHHEARSSGPLHLLAEQRAAWAARWETADVEVVGDPELTRALRLSLFHIAASVAQHGEAALGARGLTGTAYAGHVFWDTDVFVLPVLAATHPESARALLEYRIRRLPEARRAAIAAGRAGARFPWESAADGRDVTPTSGIDAIGETVPIRTGVLEEHITADVAWAAWHLAAMTGAWRFLDGPGRGLVVDTARYWASRIRIGGGGRGHIDHVIGPDEYHEDVDDNAFTNVMAAWNLRRGAELLERTAGGAGAEESAWWRSLAHILVTGYDPTIGRHEQFAGYDALEPLLAAEVGPVPIAADLVLGHRRLGGSQIVKQADVVMLHHLLPDEVPPGSRERDLDHYLPRTVHGSSLSPAVHAGVLARSGRIRQAEALLDIARRIDLDDLTGTTAAGLHFAGMGGLWQAVVFGFAGLQVTRPDDPALVLDPRLPEDWGELRFGICWHGHALRLRCRNDAVHIACARPLQVRVGDGPTTTLSPPGDWIEVTRNDESLAGSGWASRSVSAEVLA